MADTVWIECIKGVKWCFLPTDNLPERQKLSGGMFNSFICGVHRIAFWYFFNSLAATVDIMVSRVGPNTTFLYLVDYFGPIRDTIISNVDCPPPKCKQVNSPFKPANMDGLLISLANTIFIYVGWGKYISFTLVCSAITQRRQLAVLKINEVCMELNWKNKSNALFCAIHP